MPSALASQLAASVSLNAALLRDRRPPESYLFTARDAAAHDLDALHALAANALAQLSALAPSVFARDRALEQRLFSHAARSLDRTLHARDADADLDRALAAFLPLLGPWLLDPPTARLLEWLVRRFRINEFNVDPVLALFLPYHETPHFVKMLSILHIPSLSPFSFLLPFKSAAKPLPRTALVKEMVANVQLARFVAELLPTAVKGSFHHRTLLAFHAATMHHYMYSVPALDDGQLAFVLPALLTPLQAAKNDLNMLLGSYVLLCVLSQKARLKPAAISTILRAMIAPVPKHRAKGMSAAQFIKAAVAVCSPQDEVPELPLATAKKYLKIRAVVVETCGVLRVVGVEKFLLPIMQSLQNQLHEAGVSSLFSAVITCPDTPRVMTERIASMLVRLAASTNGAHDITNVARSLLGLIHQRSPELLRDVADHVLAETVPADDTDKSNDRKARRKRTDELLASFSLTYPLALSADVNEVVVASADASKEVRVDAVHKLLRSAQGETSSEDMASVRSALFGRIYDPHQSVLHALYASPDLFLSAVSLTTPPHKLLDAIVSQLQPTPPARAVLQTHAAFLAGPFSRAFPELCDAVQQDALFPFLLASKAKFKTTRGVWEAVREGGGFQTGWLKGCVQVWDQTIKANPDAEENVERMCEANLGVVHQIAANILASNDQAKDVERLLSKLQDPMPHARALAHLVCRGLLVRGSGDEQITLAARILAAMRLSSLDGLNESALKESLSELPLVARATTKMGGRDTIHALQASILALVPGLAAPRAFSGGWMTPVGVEAADHIRCQATDSDVDARYVALMRSLYILAASSATAAPTCLSTFLLRALFLNLRDSSLMFLLGILLSTASERVRTRALLQVLAFLRGHVESGIVDFQTVLPSLIAVLMDERTDRRGRAWVLESVALLSTATKKKHVYGLDTMYGDVSSDLQYLDAKDLASYVEAMVESREQLVQDARYIKVFHRRHLDGSNTKYRRRVLCFLLSHVATHPCPVARVALLRSVENLTDSTKSRMLLPAVKSLMQNPTAVSGMFGSLFDEYTSLVVAGFLTVTSAGLREEDECWAVLVALLRHCFQSNASAAARTLLAVALEERLSVDFDLERRAEMCVVLLRVGVQGGEAFLASKALLGKLLRDVALSVHLLTEFQPSHLEAESPASKRPKLEKALLSVDGDGLQALTTLAEVLGTSDTPGSVDLISRLLETLGRVVRAEAWDPSDTSYVCQMLMAAIERSASKITEPLSYPIRLEVLVELVRVTENPQMFNEALLLMANLARLAPESVLHNIMPIFTFMGSNVFHRDDSYSFKVVQNTINSIVPVMVSSLQDRYSKGLELYVGARDFLRIFTDAAHHVPRHRRQNFFVHLAEVLGPQDFLPPLCMLLIDKVTVRACGQTVEEARTALALPTALLQRFPRSLQIYVLCEVLRECLRLVSRLGAPEGDQAVFLDYARDEEHAPSLSVLRHRVQVLVLFSGTALVAPDHERQVPSQQQGSGVNDMIALLVDLATLASEPEKDGNVSGITSAAQTALARVTNAISAGEFLSAAVLMLQSTKERVKIGALGVLAERISRVSDAVRRESNATVTQIVLLAQDIIARQSAGTLAEAALAGLRALASTRLAGEEGALVTTLPHVMKVVRSGTSSVAAALAVLPCYISALGPRVIPFFREMVQECTSILSEDLEGKNQLSSAGGMALETLQSLSTSLPLFYGAAELTRIVNLYIECGASNPLAPLVKTIAKRAAPDVLLPALYHLWPSLDKKQTKLVGYFAVLGLSLKAAPRPNVLEHVRHIFTVFTEAFAFGSQEGDAHVVSAFIELVSKLNESAFRPLFRKLHDWAFVDHTSDAERRTTFCRVYVALLDHFKGLMNPYMSMLVRPLTEVLHSSPDAALWSGVMTAFCKSLENDDGGFWREDKLSAILPALLSQLPAAIHLSPVASTTQSPKQLVVKTLLSLASLLPMGSSDQLKRCNLDLLMHTRSEDPRLRALALECCSEIWKAEGGKFIGFVAETATFIAECAEDENDNVVREAHKLKTAVQAVAGSISGL